MYEKMVELAQKRGKMKQRYYNIVRIDKKTPNGGDYSQAHYLNDDYEYVPKEEATILMIRQCMADGRLVWQTKMVRKDRK